MFGAGDLGKQSSSISSCNKSSNSCPGAFFVPNLLNWRLMSIIDAFLLSLVFTICRFCLFLWAFPCIFAMDVGKCLEMIVGASPGHDLKLLFL